jgi:hypothetical protein
MERPLKTRLRIFSKNDAIAAEALGSTSHRGSIATRVVAYEKEQINRQVLSSSHLPSWLIIDRHISSLERGLSLRVGMRVQDRDV